jgi:hypothetical protein
MNKETPRNKREVGPLDFEGAALINPDGSETPITDEMIEKACNDLEVRSQKENKTHNMSRLGLAGLSQQRHALLNVKTQ